MVSEIVLQREYRGYELLVRRVSLKDWQAAPSLYQCNNYWYCGYVVIPKDHPYYGVNYMDLEYDICVHGD